VSELLVPLRLEAVRGARRSPPVKVGYSLRVFAKVVDASAHGGGRECTLWGLEAWTGLRAPLVHLVCRDLIACGHVSVRRGPVRGRVDHLYDLFRMRPESVELWEESYRWKTVRAVTVMGAHLPAGTRRNAHTIGYSEAALHVVVRRMVCESGREWRPVELAAQVETSVATVRKVCRDLAAAGHALCRAEVMRDNDVPGQAWYSLTPRGLAVWQDLAREAV
jgi:hypothetical protein